MRREDPRSKLSTRNKTKCAHQDRWNGTPLEDAIRTKRPEIIEYLNAKGGRLYDPDEQKFVRMHTVPMQTCLACKDDKAKADAALIALGIDPDGGHGGCLACLSPNGPGGSQVRVAVAGEGKPSIFLRCSSGKIEIGTPILPNRRTFAFAELGKSPTPPPPTPPPAALRLASTPTARPRAAFKAVGGAAKAAGGSRSLIATA